MLEHDDIIRLVAAAILFVLTLVMGTIPVYLFQLTKKYSKSNNNQLESGEESRSKSSSKWFTHDRIVAFLTQVGGGVLFYTAFVHMLPEIREHYEQYQKSNQTSNVTFYLGDNTDDDDDGGDDLPLVDMCACAGLFGIFLIEEIMHTLLGGHDHHHHHHHHHPQQYNPDNHPVLEIKSSTSSSISSRRRRFSFRQCIEKSKYDPQIDDECLTKMEEQNSKNMTTSIVGSKFPEISINLNNKKQSTAAAAAPVTPFSETHPISSCQQSTLCYNTCSQQCSHHDESIQQQQQRSTRNDTENPQTLEDNSVISSDSNNGNTNNLKEQSSIWPHIIENFLLILAFSCHSIFDGISIGVQLNEKEIWTMLIAILSHKLLIAFILSFQIYDKCHKKIIDPKNGSILRQEPINGSNIILCFFSTLFALMSPIGILIVMIMNDHLSAPSESSIHVIILSAISAGTILYIVFFEIVDKSSSRLHINGLIQWLALVIGFGAMHLISQLFHEE